MTPGMSFSFPGQRTLPDPMDSGFPGFTTPKNDNWGHLRRTGAIDDAPGRKFVPIKTPR